MKLAHIAPTSVLKTDIFQALDFHLCIASQVLKDPIYASYFRDAKGFVILDVPTYEEKDTEKPYSLSKLYKAIDAVQPSEVVLPDLWGGTAEQAVDIAYEAAINITEMNSIRSLRGPLQLMAVPRGSTWQECVDCAVSMSKIPGVTTFGILDSTYEKFNVHRAQAVLEFCELFPTIHLHLLGVQTTLEDIQDKAIRYRVRSADTAKLVRYGLDCKHPTYGNIPAYTGRGESYFSREVSEIQLSYIARNMRYWNDLVRQ